MVEGCACGLEPVLKDLHVRNIAVLLVKIVHGVDRERPIVGMLLGGERASPGQLGLVGGAVEIVAPSENEIVPPSEESGGALGHGVLVHSRPSENRLDMGAPGRVRHVALHALAGRSRHLIVVILLPVGVGDDLEKVGDPAELPRVRQAVDRHPSDDLPAGKDARLLRRGFEDAGLTEGACVSEVGYRPGVGGGGGQRPVSASGHRPDDRAGEWVALLEGSVCHPGEDVCHLAPR